MSEAVLRHTSYFEAVRAKIGTGTQPLGPVTPSERVQLLDILRGFALFGILQVNWLGYGNLFNFLVDGSFYTMYSFLFGLGFSIQLMRAEESGQPFLARYLRRTALLFAIGCAHFVLIWPGDIVRHYGLLAIVLLFVRRWRPALLIGLAAGLLTLNMLPRGTLPPRGDLLYRPNPEQLDEHRVAIQAPATRGFVGNALAVQANLDRNYFDAVRGRAMQLGVQLQTIDVYYIIGQGDILCMFLLGLVVGRKRVLYEPSKHRRLLWWILGVGLVVGVVGNAFDTFGNRLSDAGIDLPWGLDQWGLAYSLGNIGLCVFYLSALTLLVDARQRVRRLLAPLAYVGRMGLTNYLMQSIVLTILVTPMGFDLGHRVPGRPGFLILDAFFAVQILYSRWWFQRFRFGPVEWAWRSLTWGRLQPMRIARPQESVA